MTKACHQDEIEDVERLLTLCQVDIYNKENLPRYYVTFQVYIFMMSYCYFPVFMTVTLNKCIACDVKSNYAPALT